MSAWTNFFAAMLGASATLTGLIFVGVSINLAHILALPTLPGRAAQSLILLVIVLIISGICIIPGQPITVLGTELLCISVVVWVITLRNDLARLRKTEADYKKHARTNIVFTQLAVAPYIIASVFIMSCGITGVYWLVPAMIFSFIKAVLDAWVLLVEIKR